jgi:hypothetical protein
VTMGYQQSGWPSLSAIRRDAAALRCQTVISAGTEHSTLDFDFHTRYREVVLTS